MRRTDSEMLAYVLPLIGGTDSDLTFVERARNLTGALIAGLRGREAIEAAMGAIVIEKGEALPEPTALELVALEVERIKEGGESVTLAGDATELQVRIFRAASCVLDIERLKRNPVKAEPSPQLELALVMVPSRGDRVRVVRSAEDWEGWVPAMGELIGNQYIVEGVVQAIRQHPATVMVGDWHIPASCVELVQ